MSDDFAITSTEFVVTDDVIINSAVSGAFVSFMNSGSIVILDLSPSPFSANAVILYLPVLRYCKCSD